MWFLYFYAISTVIAILVLLITSAALNERIKRKYPGCTLKKGFWEKVSGMLPILVPFFNIILTIILIFEQRRLSDDVIREIEEEMDYELHR